MDTIIALSTPMGRSAIAVVRMSGDDSISVAKKMFSPFPENANVLKVGKLSTAAFVEHAMCVWFAAPKSYTGENMVEFHCHGGAAISAAVIEKAISLGARMARNGEFSKRAFINGKMNLSETEGVIEMIDAETAAEVKAGENLLSNKLGQATVALQDRLTDIIAQTEVALDYPEEDLEKQTKLQLARDLNNVVSRLDKLLDTVYVGRIAKYGVNVAIVGKTNVGKSSLLNALLGYDRAIVSSVEGTTRDTLDATLVYRDAKFNFVDTAGLRATENEIERLGIDRAKKCIAEADLVLLVTDDEKFDLSEIPTGKKYVVVFNKSDKFAFADAKGLKVSAKTGENVDLLKETIYKMFCENEIYASGFMLTNERHIDCLKRAKDALSQALEATPSTTIDCVALKMRESWDALGEITGSSATEEIIDRIYSKFCLGK